MSNHNFVIIVFLAIELFGLVKFSKSEIIGSGTILSENSERVDIIYNTNGTSPFKKLDNGVLQFIGNDVSSIRISCQYSKSKSDFTGWRYHGILERKVEIMIPDSEDPNEININLSSGPPIISMECFLRNKKNITNTTLIYTGKNNPPYLYNHGTESSAILLNQTTAYLPCLLNHPLDNTKHQLQLFKDNERINVRYNPLFGFKLDIDLSKANVETALGVYQCRVTNSTSNDNTSVIFDFDTFINVSYKGHGYVYVSSELPFHCKLLKNIFQNEFTWHYQWKNGTQEIVDKERIEKRSCVEREWYCESVIVTFPDIGIKSLVCAGKVLNSQTYYNGSTDVEIKQYRVPNILNNIKTDIIYNKGENVTLMCATNADPAQFEWYKNGVLFQGGIRWQINGPDKLVDGGLLLNQPDFAEANFTCNVFNSFGPPVNRTFTVSLRNKSNTILYIILIVCLITAIIASVYLLWARPKSIRLNEKIIEEFKNGKPTDDEALKYVSIKYNNGSEVDLKDIEGLKKGRVIGEGNFGIVIQGYARKGTGDKIPVAIKIPDLSKVLEKDKEEQFSKFLDEIKLTMYLGDFHNHVVAFFGANTTRMEYFEAYLIVEYCAGGDMDTYLTPFKPNCNKKFYFIGEKKFHQNNFGRGQVVLDTRRLILWCAQIASGMEYISFKGLVHRDLAARNILLGYPKNGTVSDRIEHDPERLVAKIGDFGLTRGKTDGINYYYPQVCVNDSSIARRIPVHWYSPEALITNRFSTKSDVWSFGVTVWEIFTLCKEEPFSNTRQQFTNPDQTDIREYLQTRGTLRAPPLAPRKLWDIIQPCFNINPEDRPDFKTLHDQLMELNQPEIRCTHQQGHPTLPQYSTVVTAVNGGQFFLKPSLALPQSNSRHSERETIV